MAAVEEERERQHRMGGHYLIHPLSMFRIYWEIVYCVLFILHLIIFPCTLVYFPPLSSMSISEAFMQYTECGAFPLDLANVLDMYITFNSGYCRASNKTIELSRSIIMHTYVVNRHFYYDLICSCPTFLIVIMLFYSGVRITTPIEIILYLFQFLKVLRIFKLRIYLNNTLHMLRKWHHYIKVLKYTIIAILVLHWINCTSLIIGMKVKLVKRIRVLSKEESTVFEYTYIKGYFLISVINAAHLLGISLVNGYKKHLHYMSQDSDQIIIFFVSALVGYAAINLFLILCLQLIYAFNLSEIKYYSIMYQVKEYMMNKELNDDMQKRILVYYEYRFHKKFFNETTILNLLSGTLRRDIVMYSCRNLIASVSILRDLPSETLSELLSQLKHEIFLYKDTIIQADMPGDCMYFIANGTVAVLTPNGKEICHLQDGAYFGEIALVSENQARVATVIAIEICEMYRLDRRLFMSCFPTNSQVYRRIEQIAQERTEKTLLLEELHKKYILDQITKKRAEQTARIYSN